MFSVSCVSAVHRGGSHRTAYPPTYSKLFKLDFTEQGPLDMLKLVQCVVRTVEKSGQLVFD